MRPVRILPLIALFVFVVPAADASRGRPGMDGAAPRAAAASASEPLAVLRLEPYRRSVAVRVATGNGSTGLMAFDTAAGHTVVSPEFAAAGGCKPWGNIGGFTMTGTRLDMPRCDGFRFEADGLPLVAPVAGVMQAASLLAKDAAPIEGLLALDVFAGRTITLDFAGGHLYVESPGSAARRIAGARAMRPLGGRLQ